MSKALAYSSGRSLQISSWFCLFSWCIALLSDPHVALAQNQTARVAVLELQGEVGKINQRQAWSDTVRASALRTLSVTSIEVIDREQFSALIDPRRDLSDCVGMCAAEIARAVGARWSLSGSLVYDRAQGIERVLITMKLHAYSGEILGIEQRRTPIPNVRSTLSELTQRILERWLLKSSTAARDHEQSDDKSSSEARAEPSGQVNQAPKPQTADPLHPPPSRWVSYTLKGQTRCMSPLITQDQYQRCVTSGACQAPMRWGQCRGQAYDPVRCVNLQQALHFARWSGGSLPTIAEWRTWSGVAHTQLSSAQDLFEWVSPPTSGAKGPRLQDHLLRASLKELRVMSPLRVYKRAPSNTRVPHYSRRSPPAFAISDLSFRISYLGSPCSASRLPTH